ncbi:unnamed protein product, partial [Iphiclides podalirius]
MTALQKLRWLTLEYNYIEILPKSMDKMESLVHCNLRHNQIREFPASIMKCPDLMFLQLNHNLISTMPPNFDTRSLTMLEMIDMRLNPICDMPHPEYPLVRFSEEITPNPQPSGSRVHATQALAVNATALRLPAVPAPRHGDPVVLKPGPEMDLDASSIESSEDWENSVNSSELDVQYQSDEERAENEAIGMVLPDLSRYASTAS